MFDAIYLVDLQDGPKLICVTSRAYFRVKSRKCLKLFFLARTAAHESARFDQYLFFYIFTPGSSTAHAI